MFSSNAYKTGARYCDDRGMFTMLNRIYKSQGLSRFIFVPKYLDTVRKLIDCKSMFRWTLTKNLQP